MRAWFLVALHVCVVNCVLSQADIPQGEVGRAFDEIVVHSNLNVRGKSGARKGKTLPLNSSTTTSTTTRPGAKVVVLSRERRGIGRQRYPYNRFPDSFPSSSSSSSQASSNAFNQNTPFGNFGAGASQSASQSQNFGPNGFTGSAGQSASQTYKLPNGNQIDVTFSGGYNFGSNGPNFAQSHSVTLTRPNGQKIPLNRG